MKGGALRGGALLLAAAACVGPYVPATAALPSTPPADAFARALAAVRARYPRILLADADRFRIRTDWIPHERAGIPGQRRATLFVDPPGTLNVVVETRYLGFDVLGGPRWSSVRGDPSLERELLELVLSALH